MNRVNQSESEATTHYTLRSDYVRCTLYTHGEGYGRDKEKGTPTKTRVNKRYAVFSKLPPGGGEDEYRYQIKLYTKHNCLKMTNKLELTREVLCGLESGTWNDNRPNFCWTSRVVLVTYLAIITEGETWLFQADCANSEDCNVLERWKDIMATHLGFETSWSIRLESGPHLDSGDRISLYLTTQSLSLVRVNPPLCAKKWPLMQCLTAESDVITKRFTLTMAGSYTESHDVYRFSTRRSAEMTQTIKKFIERRRVDYARKSSVRVGSEGSGGSVRVLRGPSNSVKSLQIPSGRRMKSTSSTIREDSGMDSCSNHSDTSSQGHGPVPRSPSVDLSSDVFIEASYLDLLAEDEDEDVAQNSSGSSRSSSSSISVSSCNNGTQRPTERKLHPRLESLQEHDAEEHVTSRNLSLSSTDNEVCDPIEGSVSTGNDSSSSFSTNQHSSNKPLPVLRRHPLHSTQPERANVHLAPLRSNSLGGIKIEPLSVSRSNKTARPLSNVHDDQKHSFLPMGRPPMERQITYDLDIDMSNCTANPIYKLMSPAHREQVAINEVGSRRSTFPELHLPLPSHGSSKAGSDTDDSRYSSSESLRAHNDLDKVYNATMKKLLGNDDVTDMYDKLMLRISRQNSPEEKSGPGVTTQGDLYDINKLIASCGEDNIDRLLQELVTTASTLNHSDDMHISSMQEEMLSKTYKKMKHGFHDILHADPPTPDTLRLSKPVRQRLCCHLYTDDASVSDWATLADIVGLSQSAVATMKGFVAVHGIEMSAPEMVLRHWQHVYNTQSEGSRHQIPVCSGDQLHITLSNAMGRSDLSDQLEEDNIMTGYEAADKPSSKQCCFNAGPASQTLDQNLNNVGISWADGSNVNADGGGNADLVFGEDASEPELLPASRAEIPELVLSNDEPVQASEVSGHYDVPSGANNADEQKQMLISGHYKVPNHSNSDGEQKHVLNGITNETDAPDFTTNEETDLKLQDNSDDISPKFTSGKKGSWDIMGSAPTTENLPLVRGWTLLESPVTRGAAGEPVVNGNNGNGRDSWTDRSSVESEDSVHVFNMSDPSSGLTTEMSLPKYQNDTSTV